MPIDPEHGAFEPDATAAMGEAFDAACEELRDVGDLQLVRKLLAQRIIEAALAGELDPVRLRAAALSRFPVRKKHVVRSLVLGDRSQDDRSAQL